MSEESERLPPAASAAKKRGPSRRVGILDLLNDSAPRGWDRVYASHFRRQFVSITPQAISVWCRQLGHRVFYASYYGQNPPHTLLPADLDVLFIGSYTKASALAYALAKLFRRQGALTVIGGPHARCFPEDCLRFFDLVVGDCDRSLVDDILLGHFDPPAVISSGRPLADVPSVEERLPEIVASSLCSGKRSFWKAVPLIASVGCPYTCDFCVDWNNAYLRLPSERLAADLRYLSEHHPGVLVAYHDPNFGVQFDRTMDAIETLPESRRNPYVMESSLSVLKESRLERLRRTRCVYVAAGVESWADYSNKAGAGATRGEQKLSKITEHFQLLRRYIEGFQANFVFGTDVDRGREPLELTKEFVRRLPFVWPGVNIPTPFGRTPLFQNLLAEGRILRSMPFAFYYNPYLTFIPAHYQPAEYYRNLMELFSVMTAPRVWIRRLTSGAHPLVKFIHSVQSFGVLHELGEMRRIKKLLESDSTFRAFHEGRSAKLPEFYHHRFEARLGPYAELISRSDRIPLHPEGGAS
jgi:radical SAM superfamily enzyme YgiQ (UPF0313 family)